MTKISIINKIEIKKINDFYEKYYKEKKIQYLKEMTAYINRLRQLEHEKQEVK